MDPIPDIIIWEYHSGFGIGVSGAGDFNNDGYDDILVGDGANAYVYYGGSTMDNTPDFIMKGEGNWMFEFGSSLALAGDINNDDYIDILVGDPSSCAVGDWMGRAYIYSNNIKSEVKKVDKELPSNQNYPNPFHTQTTIEYNLHNTTKVVIKIFNSTGQELEILTNGSQAAGLHKVVWQPKGLPEGIYFCRIQSSEFSETKKMILQKK
jgi:hypothetical protein